MNFEEYRERKLREKEREELARKLESGEVRLQGTDSKGRTIRLGTHY